MKIEERNFLNAIRASQCLFLAVCISRGAAEITLSEPTLQTESAVTPTTRPGQTAFITEWRWISEERYSTVESWSPESRLDHAFFSHKGEQWLYGGHINAKDYYDLWLASGNEPWTRIPLPSGLIQAGPPKRAALCVVGGILALYPLAGDTVWLLDVDDNVWTAFVCFGSSVVAANGTTKNYCPGNPGENAISWCDAGEGRLFVYSGNVTWSFSLSSPHWLSHVIPQSEASRLSRCGSTIQAGLAESEKSGLYLLCAEDDFGVRNVLRLKVNQNKGVEVNDLGSLALPQGNVSSLGMTVAICDEIVALVLAQEDNLPVWVIDNETGFLVKTGNSWVGQALKWMHIYSAVDYTVTCGGNTYRLRNPRIQPEVTEPARRRKYWPSRRGSFQMSLIELGELIKVDQDGLHLYHRRTATEALLFFALSLLMFLTFGVAWFFKRCVTIPTVPRGWPGSWGRPTGLGGVRDCTPTARYTPIPRGEIGLTT
ncbi:uncharacterized protein LOC105683657 [Athalia rosae]|uniref:uncharacterized protein LOC105683657 n=1 Tax=Athalia rosae TaxID=37344 RepID=UPI000A0EE068|nr:uncharacterized protein LOC105683657 [Athalia rosae]XP_020706697.1 uncharacterized protein LOC105683657 [Athalia rosae]XP_020706698.1 uncharacterized protein LOC105683657 [Athalia rosae]XP_048506331.1 uncharacterized protein LOC105683657 [Athalia rosae]XP_048506337.1 uncharacterized protein LOC105683657 [Athalia rosae]XP_048506340.1 uncharacterized protein LOC105683657 [Athalia rosae]